jgi:hypothetical protein
MTCTSFLTFGGYSNKTLFDINGGTATPSGNDSTQWLNQWATYLATNSCTLVKSVYDSNIAGGLPLGFLQDGSSIQRPTQSNIGLTYTGPVSTTAGFSLEFKTADINGNLSSIGFIDIGYIYPTAPSDGCNFGNPTLTFADRLSGTWPIVIGQNGVYGYTISSVPFAGNQFTGDYQCPPGTHHNYPGFQGVLWHGVCLVMGNLSFVTGVDAPDLWCCVSAGFNCCGAGGTDRTGFLIPRPATLTPGQENSSVPVLNKLLYFANHTFQFHNNFGRKR